MFGSTTSFGQSSNSPFGSPSVSGQNGYANNNQFIPKPCGSTTSFGSPTGGSMFYGTSTSIFGTNSSSSESTSTFGAPLYSAFGSSSAPAFGSSSSSFGGAQSTTPTFGTTSFGQSVFCSQHGRSRVAAYTTTAEVDDGSSAAKLESISAMTINKDKSHEELRWEDYLFGDKGGPHCMGQSAGGIGGSTVQSRSFVPSPTLAQSPDNPFYSSTASNSFAPQTCSTPFAPQSTTPTFETTDFGHLAFSSQPGGSRVAAYTATAEVDGAFSTQHASKLHSISAMPINKDKSHEEFRWEDYQSGDKEGPIA